MSDLGMNTAAFTSFEKLVEQWNAATAEYEKAVADLEAAKGNSQAEVRAQGKVSDKFEQIAMIKSEMDKLIRDAGGQRGVLNESLVVGYFEKPSAN